MWRFITNTGQEKKSMFVNPVFSDGIQLLSDGLNPASGIRFGPTQDTSLYRSVAGFLKTDGGMNFGGAIFLRGATTTDARLYFGVSNDTHIYRSAAAELTTNSAIQTLGKLIRILNVAGTENRVMLHPDFTAADQPAVALYIAGGSERVRLSVAAGPAGQPGLLLQGDTNLYRSAGGALKTDGSFNVGGNIVANQGLGGEMRLSSNNALYFDSGGSNYLYRPATGQLATGGLLQSQGMFVQRHPYGTQRHMESGTGTTSGNYLSVTFTTAFSSAPNVVPTGNSHYATALNGAPSTTGCSIVNGTDGQIWWIAEGPN